MRIMHLSDLHLGKKVYAYSMLEDQKYILKQILSCIDRLLSEEEGLACVMIAGDVYDRSVPPSEAVQLFDAFLVELAERKLEVCVIAGNHDSAERIAFGQSLMDGSGIHMSPVYDGNMKVVTLNDAFGPVDIYMLPFITPAKARTIFAPLQEAETPAEEVKETEDVQAEESAIKTKEAEDAQCEEKEDHQIHTYSDAVKAALEAQKPDPSHRSILLTHQFVTGARRSESEERSIGGTDNIDASVFGDFDYVALGHIHKPQNMASGKDAGRAFIRYCGTPLKYSLSEAEDIKSASLLTLNEKKDGSAPADFISCEEIPLQPLRDLRQIRGTYQDLMRRDSYEGTNTEDYIFAVLTDEEDIPDAAGKLQIVYPNLMNLTYDNTRTRSAGAEDLTTAEDDKSPIELLDDFYEMQNGSGLNDQQKNYAAGLIQKIWGTME